MFHRIDRDHSGYLNQRELSEAVHEFYTSTDPDAAGNNLFGPLA